MPTYRATTFLGIENPEVFSVARREDLFVAASDCLLRSAIFAARSIALKLRSAWCISMNISWSPSLVPDLDPSWLRLTLSCHSSFESPVTVHLRTL